MKQRERRALRVALWATIISACMTVASFLLFHLQEDLNEFQYAYSHGGVSGFIGLEDLIHMSYHRNHAKETQQSLSPIRTVFIVRYFSYTHEQENHPHFFTT